MAETTTNRPALKNVNLPKDTIDDLDSIGLNLSSAIEDATGVPVELSRPQIIASIAKKVLSEMDAQDAEDESDDAAGSED